MNYGSAITQKANVPLTSEGQAESRTLAQGQLELGNYHDTILCKSSNMEVKTRSGNCLWFSALFGWSMHPSLSYLPFLVFSFVRILLFILMPTFYTGILTRPFFFTVGEPGFVPVVLTQRPKSLALLVLDHPIVLQPLAMEGCKCTLSSRMWASVYVHLILLPAYERVTVTDLLFKKKQFFFDLVRMLYGGLGAMRKKPPKREIIMRHVTRTHHKDRYSF